MNAMILRRQRAALCAVALFLAGGATAADASRDAFVAVPGYGAVVDVPGTELPRQLRTDARAVFPATRAAPSPGAVVPALEKAARYLNLLAREGVRTRASRLR
jgi:hypothetical protein